MLLHQKRKPTRLLSGGFSFGSADDKFRTLNWKKMKDAQTLQKDFIDFSDLSDFLLSNWRNELNFDKHYMQVVEKVTFLCVNDDFIKDIQNISKLARQELTSL